MTARNLQDKVRKAGLPWSAAKGFDTFTPIGYALFLWMNAPHFYSWADLIDWFCIVHLSGWVPKQSISDPHNLRLSLSVSSWADLLAEPNFFVTVEINGQTKQDGSTGDMIFKIPQLIEHVSSIMTFEVRFFLYQLPTEKLNMLLWKTGRWLVTDRYTLWCRPCRTRRQRIMCTQGRGGQGIIEIRV